jgi:hypothetical protein
MPSPPGRDDADGRVSCFLLSLGVNAPRGGVYRIAPRLTIRRKKVSTSSSEALSAAALFFTFTVSTKCKRHNVI